MYIVGWYSWFLDNVFFQLFSSNTGCIRNILFEIWYSFLWRSNCIKHFYLKMPHLNFFQVLYNSSHFDDNKQFTKTLRKWTRTISKLLWSSMIQISCYKERERERGRERQKLSQYTETRNFDQRIPFQKRNCYGGGKLSGQRISRVLKILFES